jgi:hypothetical protein
MQPKGVVNMAKNSYGATLITDMSDSDIEKTLDKKALADLKKNSKPQSIALTHLASETIGAMETGTTFTVTDLFLLLHKDGHKDTNFKSLQTVLARLVKDPEFPLTAVKIVGRQRGYQKT